MSTLGDKARGIAGGVVRDSFEDSESSGSGFIILMFIFGLVVSMVLGWVIFPRLLYSQKYQPFSFNHVLHVSEVSEGCKSCHFFRKDGSFSGIPKNEKCIDCHSEVIGESDQEKVYINEYLSQGKEVPWLLYFKQPNCVFFSHAAHVKGSEEIGCVVCHGHVGESKHSKSYEYNRITGYSRNIWGKNIAGIKWNTWDRMKMDDCAECHERYGEVHISSIQTGRDACFVCHK